MKVLGIESSCDETGVALYDTERGLLGHAVHTQVAMHEAYGGVVPELASRDHVRRLIPLLERVLAEAACTRRDIDAIAYTAGPGLAGALLVGASFAEALAMALAVPVLPVHHLEGHLLSPLLADEANAFSSDITPASGHESALKLCFPFIALLVSGGHTQLMRVARVGDYRLLGESLDDAAGEAFDKTAKLLGLGYPGGPALAKLAESGKPGRYKLPRPMLNSGDLSFSFSGLKTAVLTAARAQALSEADRADLAAEFQEAVTEVLAAKAVAACRQHQLSALVVAGGVGANRRLRQRLDEAMAKIGGRVFYPALELCTDNGAMIAFAGSQRLLQGEAPNRGGAFAVRPRWPLDQIP
ncbi:MAG: tRNA (adenosine(37)-N6)-threonylcarbamoyltransferase complex transferase subunit TsaD [Sulfuritalea sp.]|nr:tRNA (adenosine(37)-N6)-threonylcarbamoyltransferase complex transferase subunit TsaD [Sulfuritalea sp.]